jgi:hypothetical protein
MKIEVHPSLEVSPRQVNKGWRKHKGELKKAFEEIGSDVEDRLARTEALKRIGTAFPLGSGMVDKRDFHFLFPFGTGTTAGASNSSVTKEYHPSTSVSEIVGIESRGNFLS